MTKHLIIGVITMVMEINNAKVLRHKNETMTVILNKKKTKSEDAGTHKKEVSGYSDLKNSNILVFSKVSLL